MTVALHPSLRCEYRVAEKSHEFHEVNSLRNQAITRTTRSGYLLLARRRVIGHRGLFPYFTVLVSTLTAHSLVRLGDSSLLGNSLLRLGFDLGPALLRGP